MFHHAVSIAELRNIYDGVAVDVRADGRPVTMQRPPVLHVTHDETLYNGSRVEVNVEGTHAIAVARASVVEVEDERPGGRLLVHVDAAANVIAMYAKALGGNDNQYKRTFLSHVAATISGVFGAMDVTSVQEMDGVAEAELLQDESVSDGNAANLGTGSSGFDSRMGFGIQGAGGFPSAALHIGDQFVFQIDVDVYVPTADGGNLVGVAALAVHAALRTMQLPHVTLHHASTGTSAEVNPTKSYDRPVDWSRLPALLLFLVAPSRHYVLDPSFQEEVALPQRLYVAMDSSSQLVYVRAMQFPSKRGNRPIAAATAAPPTGEEGNDPSHAPTAALNGSIPPPHMLGLQLADIAAIVKDAGSISLQLLEECDRQLVDSEKHVSKVAAS